MQCNCIPAGRLPRIRLPELSLRKIPAGYRLPGWGYLPGRRRTDSRPAALPSAQRCQPTAALPAKMGHRHWRHDGQSNRRARHRRSAGSKAAVLRPVPPDAAAPGRLCNAADELAELQEMSRPLQPARVPGPFPRFTVACACGSSCPVSQPGGGVLVYGAQAIPAVSLAPGQGRVRRQQARVSSGNPVTGHRRRRAS